MNNAPFARDFPAAWHEGADHIHGQGCGGVELARFQTGVNCATESTVQNR